MALKWQNIRDENGRKPLLVLDDMLATKITPVSFEVESFSGSV
jgi:hypothetical protein